MNVSSWMYITNTYFLDLFDSLIVAVGQHLWPCLTVMLKVEILASEFVFMS